jgi:hypothetical protein
MMAACLVLAMLLPAPTGADERTITCESRNFRYNYCRVDTDHRVYLSRQRSSTRCRQYDNWGYDGRGVWVDRGCAAEFRVGRGGDYYGRNYYGGDSGGSNRGAAIAGAAVAGVAIAAAVAASRDRNHHSDPVPSWAVGTFRGYDDVERMDVEITVRPGGAVSGVAGGSSFSGTWDGNRLQAGRHAFRVERSGTGFIATDDSGRGNRISFNRAGGGY